MNETVASSSQRGLRIGELAARVGATADTIRFYEKEGWLPSPLRASNSYRSYTPEDVEHIRLLLELRRLDVPLEAASQLASWCHSGHCAQTTTALPKLIGSQRESISERIEQLKALDARLARLEAHLGKVRRPQLAVLDTSAPPCCDSAAALLSAGAACRCCATT